MEYIPVILLAIIVFGSLYYLVKGEKH